LYQKILGRMMIVRSIFMQKSLVFDLFKKTSVCGIFFQTPGLKSPSRVGGSAATPTAKKIHPL